MVLLNVADVLSVSSIIRLTFRRLEKKNLYLKVSIDKIT